MRAEAGLAIRAEDLLAHVVKRALQVAEGDALVDNQALNLVELRKVRGVSHIAAVHLARRDNVDGKLLVLHHVNLHAGSLSTQQHVGLAAHVRAHSLAVGIDRTVNHIERILHGTAGMIGRRVQSREIVVVGLHLGSFGYRIAQAKEDLGNLVNHAVDEMARAHLLRATGKRHVNRRRVNGGLKLGRIQHGLTLGKRLLNRDARLVDGLTHRCALLLGHLAHRAQIARQRAGLANDGNAHLVELSRSGRRRDIGQRRLTQSGQFIGNCHVPSAFPISQTLP